MTATTNTLTFRATRILGSGRTRAMRVTAFATIGSLGLLVDLLLVGHTSGEEIWGPITAALATGIGALSYAYLASRARNRLGRFAIYALWATVAFFGFAGYNDHRLPLPPGTIEERARPPLSPLIFTVIGVAGAAALWSGAKEA